MVKIILPAILISFKKTNIEKIIYTSLNKSMVLTYFFPYINNISF